jgi:hypothetical protein
MNISAGASFVSLAREAMLPVPRDPLDADHPNVFTSPTSSSSSLPLSISHLWKPLPIELVASESGENHHNLNTNNKQAQSQSQTKAFDLSCPNKFEWLLVLCLSVFHICSGGISRILQALGGAAAATPHVFTWLAALASGRSHPESPSPPSSSAAAAAARESSQWYPALSMPILLNLNLCSLSFRALAWMFESDPSHALAQSSDAACLVEACCDTLSSSSTTSSSAAAAAITLLSALATGGQPAIYSDAR